MPKLHKKPTIEELDETINKSVEELDKEEETPATPPEETPELPKEDKPIEEPEKEEETPKETPEEEKEEKKPEDKPEDKIKDEEKPKEEPRDYRKRYEDSSREAHILYSKSKKLTEVIEKAGDVPEPTEEELQTEYPEWDVMSDFEKKLAKKNMMNDRRFDAIGEATKEFKDMDTWNKKVDEFLTDPVILADNPELEGKEEEFKMFSTKQTRRGADFKDLVSAFLYEEGQKPKITNRGKMFETGTGGLNNKPKPKSDKISVEESRLLRITDYKKYIQYVKEGKIDDSQL